MIKKISEKVYQFFVKHWFISTIASTVAGLWFLVAQILGKQFEWVDTNGVVKPFVIMVFWFCTIISFFYTLFKTNFEFKSTKKNLNDKEVLDEVISCNNSINTKIFHRLLTYVKENKECKADPFNMMFDGEKEAEDLLEQFNICLSKTLNIKRERIGLSLAVKLSNSDEWQLLSKLHTSNNSSINDLFQNRTSTAYELINQGKEFLFKLDKTKAYGEHTYIKSNKDGEKVQGSIICCDMSVSSNGEKYINAILSITTYEIKICEDKDKEEVEHKIKNIIIPGFEKYIDQLLLKYYITIKHKTA